MAIRRGAHQPDGSGKTILILEDESSVRKLVATMLSSNGYKVLTAGNGESAIRAFQRSKQPIDLVLLDVVSPGLSGPMVAERLVALKPGLRILFMSGYGNTNVVQHFVVGKGCALLTKPFTEQQLTRKVREVLNAPPENGKSPT
jgi:DNA-binding NtrC family response regulator